LFSDAIYAALVATVFLTTLAAPPALAARLRKRHKAETSADVPA
jgi:hypothetical protein